MEAHNLRDRGKYWPTFCGFNFGFIHLYALSGDNIAKKNNLG